MLSRWLQALLLTEAIGHALLTWAWLRHGGGIAGALAICVFIAVCWRLSHALATFAVARLLFRPAAGTTTWRTSMAALRGEWVARFVSFNWSQPFPGRALPAEPFQPGTAGLPPVLLVHGYLSNRGMWVCFAAGLRAAGRRVYTLTLEPPVGSIDDFAQQLQQRIESICAATQAPQLDVVAHSMGGLVVRACFCRYGAGRVRRLVTLGSPHQGSRMARLGQGRCAVQMRPGSAWLATLAAQERTATVAHYPPTLSLYTHDDDIVLPPDSARLDWAETRALSGVGHVGLLFSPPVLAAVRTFLDSPR